MTTLRKIKLNVRNCVKELSIFEVAGRYKCMGQFLKYLSVIKLNSVFVSPNTLYIFWRRTSAQLMEQYPWGDGRKLGKEPLKGTSTHFS